MFEAFVLLGIGIGVIGFHKAIIGRITEGQVLANRTAGRLVGKNVRSTPRALVVLDYVVVLGLAALCVVAGVAGMLSGGY